LCETDYRFYSSRKKLEPFMEGKLNRRDFVVAGTAAGLSLAIAGKAESQALQAPNIITRKVAEPVVIASSNGHRFKNGGTVTAVEKAFTMMVGGADVLDSLIAGVNIVELDPLDDSVGYGGLPNAEGVVQLDSCVMHGPKRRAGGVASIRRGADAVACGEGGDGDD